VTGSSQAPDKRTAIIEAALELFGARGYAATTMEAVAEQAGIAKGSIYNYFRNKDHLFEQVFLEVLADDEAGVLKALAECRSASEKLESVLDRWYANLERYRRIGRLALEYWVTVTRENRDDAPMNFAQYCHLWHDRIADILREGVASGEFAADTDPEIGSTLLRSAMDGITLQCILDLGIKVNSDLLARLKMAVSSTLNAAVGQVRTHEKGETQ